MWDDASRVGGDAGAQGMQKRCQRERERERERDRMKISGEGEERRECCGRDASPGVWNSRILSVWHVMCV